MKRNVATNNRLLDALINGGPGRRWRGQRHVEHLPDVRRDHEQHRHEPAAHTGPPQPPRRFNGGRTPWGPQHEAHDQRGQVAEGAAHRANGEVHLGMLHDGRLMAVKTITAGVMDEKQVETLAAELNDLCTFVCTPCISSSHTFLIESRGPEG